MSTLFLRCLWIDACILFLVAGQFNRDWFKTDSQETIETFFNTNDLDSSDQNELNFEKFVSAFSNCLKKYALLKRARQKKSAN